MGEYNKDGRAEGKGKYVSEFIVFEGEWKDGSPDAGAY
jgi:hypothetical protein